ncbi:hypothetical protein [Elizabethkingia anophelis]|uniref:hypothetical protein n=1 Tax=Elizabethkingia anophelis TaxID=1117645 RepID=UPI00063ADE4E|nr:hypothetical protein [Elizabethkingia anophelis]
MKYLILLEYNKCGKVLFSTEVYDEAVSRFLAEFEEANKVNDSDIYAYCTLRPNAHLSYKISHYSNEVTEYLMAKGTKFCFIYIIKCNGRFDHNKLKRVFSNYYSRQITTLDSFIYFEYNLN